MFSKYFSFGKLGYDKLGCPGYWLNRTSVLKFIDTIKFERALRLVYACAQGRMDFRGMFQSVTKKDYMKYQIWMTEKTNREMRDESISTGGNPWCHITFIADMEELSIRQMAYKPGTDQALKIPHSSLNALLHKLWTAEWNKPRFTKLTIRKTFEGSLLLTVFLKYSS